VRAWNRRYGDFFLEPLAVYTDSPIILGTDGVNKMSKSLGNTIESFADEPTLRKQVMCGHRHRGARPDGPRPGR
jgi:tryptophanyl-tRNA synthetase